MPALVLHHVITSEGWNAWIFMLGPSQFIRHYYEHTIQFLFLWLLICANAKLHALGFGDAHWSGLITRNITPEEDVPRCACPAPPRHMHLCNQCPIET